MEEIVIPNSVKKIAADAFLSCSCLKKVTIENKEADISTDAFRNCNAMAGEGDFSVMAESLTGYKGNDSEIVIPEGIKSIFYPQIYC